MTRHGPIIEDIIATHPGATNRGFLKEIRHIYEAMNIDHGPPDLYLRPDAYLIDRDERLVVCYEVEVTHAVSHERIMAYYDILNGLESGEWNLLLIIFDRYGNQRGFDFLSAMIDECGNDRLRRALVGGE